MRSSISRFSFLLLLVLVGLIASSCVAMPSPISATTASQDPPAAGIQVSPDTTDPPTLDVIVSIDQGQNDSDGLTAITVQFSTNEIHNQNFVQFNHGEKVKCNNVLLSFGDTAYSARVPASNNTYTCTYQRGKKIFIIISIQARTPLSPLLTSDTSGNTFTVRYHPDKTQFRSQCQVKVNASDDTQTIFGRSLPENGNGVYTGPDRSALTGEGTLVMTRVCTFNLKGAATAFEKVTATYTSTATSEVVWFGPP